jgi:D-3-phosphoglycerate dehydrogenase / 2-oxoglutarate reductase
MKKNISILCIILARGGSKGIPGKNIFPINNHPLISYTITAGLGSKYIKDVIVSTDDKKISKEAKSYGAKVPFLRPKKLAKDKTLSVDALRFTVLEYEKFTRKKFDYVIELPCVSPFRDSNDINIALEKLINSKSDSVISYVNTGEKHPTRLKRIKNLSVSDFCKEYPEPKRGSRRQDFESCFIRNGAIYAMTRECIVNQKSRQGKKSLPFIMDESKSINIDNKFDLLVAKTLIENGHCNNVPKKRFIEKKFFYNKQKPKLLITTPLHFTGDLEEKFKNKYECTITKTENLKDLKKILINVDAWLCSPCPTYVINRDLLENAKNLKLIVTPSTGSNHIDVKYCKKRTIKIKTLLKTKFIKNIYASSEFTFSLMLSVLKKIPKAISAVKSGHWRDEEDLLRSKELFGKNLGIIGFGRIGSNIAKYAKAFKMNIFTYDPFKKIKNKSINQKKRYQDVLKNSDILFICVNLNDKTKNMVNKSWFKEMKKGAILINTSRGEVIEEKQIIKSLQSKKLSYVATDVVANEQNDISKNILVKYSKKNDNLIITPHVAGLTNESETKAAKQSYITLNRFFKND